jgi:phosphohistidine phosphatase
MGRRLAAQSIKPDMIVASPARRASKTARRLAAELGFGKKHIEIIEEIYGASADELLEIIRGLDNDAAVVVIVGHNPETTVLANILGDFDIDNVPTCGVVAFDFPVDSWGKVSKGKGTLAFFDYPRKGD